jgi:uncharacterized protein (TIGR02145 family)
MKKILSLIALLTIFSCSTSTDENGNSNTTVVPLPPTGLTGNVVSTTQINLTWTDNSTNETGFKIERKTGSANYAVVGTVNQDVLTFSDTGLTPSTTYTYRVYAFNAVGNSLTYTNEVTLTTTAILALPTLTTTAASSITQTTATSGGNISSDGSSAITARGVVWSTSANPTIALTTKTTDGTGTGAFSSNITGLMTNTTYYIRAYATNSQGTAYGNVFSFTTQAINYAAMYPIGTVFCSNVVTAVVDVTNPVTGKTWMDRNLGASQVANSSADANAYGDLYQWGRRSDGHQCRTSPTTTIQSSIDQPANGSFILTSNSPFDWRSPQNNNLWQGVNGVNNPCPNGYRLPTETELNTEITSWSSQNSTGAFGSPLKLPMAGARDCGNGSLGSVIFGSYWSSSVNTFSGNTSNRLSFFSSNSSVGIGNSVRAYGNSVRCLKD